MGRLRVLLTLLACLVAISFESERVSADQMALSNILPKLQAIHEDAQSLLIKNSELKSKILVGLQAHNEAKLKQAKESKYAPPGQTNSQPAPNGDKAIDYSELEEFNKWVDSSLDYAVKNTAASIEALKEEAQLNNGNVEYTDQAINDGIEGVKYWQSAVIFQDKTLKNEKFEVAE